MPYPCLLFLQPVSSHLPEPHKGSLPDHQTHHVIYNQARGGLDYVSVGSTGPKKGLGPHVQKRQTPPIIKQSL